MIQFMGYHYRLADGRSRSEKAEGWLEIQKIMGERLFLVDEFAKLKALYQAVQDQANSADAEGLNSSVLSALAEYNKGAERG